MYNAECTTIEGQYAECHYSEGHYTEGHCGECCNAEGCYAECLYADCIVAGLSVVMLSVCYVECRGALHLPFEVCRQSCKRRSICGWSHHCIGPIIVENEMLNEVFK